MAINIPVLLIGMVIGTYWARVLKLVAKTRRKTGKSANFLPPETLGRILRILWYPAVVLWIALPFAIALIPDPPAIVRPLFQHPAIQWIPATIALADLAATWLCWQ